MSDFTDIPIPPPPGPQPVPWERAGAGLADFWSTFKLFVTRPDESFARVPVTNAVGRALVFGLVVYSISNAIGLLWNLALGNTMQELLEKLGGDAFRGLGEQPVSPVVGYLIQVAITPVVFLLLSLIGSGIIHLMLLMFGGAPGGFTTTLRVNYYSAVSAIAAVIPFIGGLISLVWWIVLLIIGLKAAHRIPMGRSVAAVLVPLALCCVCAVVLGVMFATALMTMFGVGSN